MGKCSIVLIVVLVFGLLFSLLYSSTLVASQNSNGLYSILEAKKVEASLNRLKNPEHVCFTLDNDTLVKYSFLSALIKEADGIANELEPPSTKPLSNRYDGFGMGVNATDTVPLIRQYQKNFNHTIAIVTIQNYADDVHIYDCNFAYNGNQYYLNVRFQSLTALNDSSGFVPIDITDNKKGMITHFTTYNTFNNTAVWTNHLDSHAILTLQTEIDKQQVTVSTEIPPGKSWDYRLQPDYSKPEDTVYHYQVQENNNKTVSGDIIVKHYPKCMSPEMARSLYSQSDIDMKFPDYLPLDYRYICGIHFYNTVLIQAYWNRTVENPMEEKYGEAKAYDFPNYAFHPDALNDGVIQIIAGKSGIFTPYTDAQERYDEIKNKSYYLDQQLVVIDNPYDGKEYRAVVYRHNLYVEKDIFILEMYDEDDEEFYFFKGKVPLSELVKMAESLKS